MDDAQYDLLCGLHADCLEPGDALAARQAIDAQPEAYAAWRDLGAPGVVIQPLSPRPALSLAPRAAATLDAGPPQVFEVQGVRDPAAWRPVVFAASEDGVRVLHPVDAQGYVTLAALPGPPPALHLPPLREGEVWWVVLAPADRPDDGARAWQALRDEALRGGVPSWRVHPGRR